MRRNIAMAFFTCVFAIAGCWSTATRCLAEESQETISSAPRSFDAPEPSEKLEHVPTADLYAEFKKRSEYVLTSPPETLNWIKLPKPKSLNSFGTTGVARSLQPATLSVYDDLSAGRSPASIYDEVSTLNSDQIAAEMFARSAKIRKSIYGSGDRRIDVYTAEERRRAAKKQGDSAPIEREYIEKAKSVGFILHESMLRALPNGNFYAMPEAYGITNGLCTSELFGEQPCLSPGGIGTAFLISDTEALTAKHCVPENIDTDSLRIVFGFALYSKDIPPTIAFRKEDVFKFKVVESDEIKDWAVLKMDRKTSRAPLKMGNGKPSSGTEVYALGYPSALPLKISPQGSVRSKLNDKSHFLASVDAFGGNSGSPIINSKTHEVEGILVSGNEDFRLIPSGQCSRSVIINDAHAGETICSISAIPKR